MSKPLKVQIVEKARSLVEGKEHWCRGTLAMDAHGNPVCPTDPTAQRRCALGALIAAAHELTYNTRQAYDLALSVVRSCRATSTLVNINDVRGHAAVLAFFDEVIATA